MTRDEAKELIENSERKSIGDYMAACIKICAVNRDGFGLIPLGDICWAQRVADLEACCEVQAEPEEDKELVRRLTGAMREADDLFERAGGSTRHHVQGCLLPVLRCHGLQIVVLPSSREDIKKTVTCSLCGEEAPAITAHLHQDKWIGDECCWTEQLRGSE